MEKPNKWEKDPGHFGTSAGDLGVIVIAAFCTVTFIAILFSRWDMPKLAGALAPPAPAKIQPKPETDMMLFPSQPPKKR